MKKQLLVLIALVACLTWACDKKITMNDSDADEDAETDVTGDETSDPDEDFTDDPVDDPTEDPTEDPVDDPTEDPMEDPGEDSSVDSPADSDDPELPTGCTLPSIPDDGLYIYYCMEEDSVAAMRFYRIVELAAGGTIDYAEVMDCRVTTPARDMLCHVAEWDSSTSISSGDELQFNISTPGVSLGWACSDWVSTAPWDGVANGIPVVKYMGTWLTLSDPVMYGSRCMIDVTMP